MDEPKMSTPSMYKNEGPMCPEGKALLASELQFLRAQTDTKTKAKPEEAKANKRKVRREEVEEYILLKMYPPSNQPQAPDEEEEDQPEELEDGDNFKSKDSTIKDPVSASSPMKISYGKLIQEGFNLTSPKPKAKKRKAEIIEVHGDGGGRIVRSTGRKDRHSKVRTARGPRDRRVRLSPRTAIQFYDVQDRLGCDRPSKAIDWLIKEAKTAIDALDQLPHLERNNHFSDTNATENHSPPILNHGGFVISESGMIEKSEHLNDDSPASGFSFRFDGAAPSSSTELQAYLDQDFNTSRNRSEASDDVIFYPSYPQGFCSAFTAASQIMETNSGIATLQKMLSWNYGNDNSGSTRGGRGGRGGGGAGGGDRAEYSSVNSPPLHSPAQPISGDNHMFSQREPLQSSIINYSPIGADFPGFNFSNELSNIIASATLKEDENEKKLVFSRPSSTAPFLHYEE